MSRFMLRTNEYLKTNEFLLSTDNRYFLIMQGDGNLVEYVGTGPHDNRGYVWDSNTPREVDDYFVVMQGDGNLVVYKGMGPHDNRGYVWDSNTPREVDDYFAILQGDGNFVVYKGIGPVDNRGYVWDSGVVNPIGSTNFRPSVHGWPFRNDFQGSGFGNWGLCGGMCWTALDRYHKGILIQRNLTSPLETALNLELVISQMNSLLPDTWKKIADWQRRPDLGHWWLPHSVGHLTKAEWPKLKDRVGTGMPAVLCLIRVEGYDPALLKDNHQVIAYQYEYNVGTKDLTIWVYDPNWPNNDDVRLTMNFGLPRSNINAKQNTGERLRGFFVM